MSNARTPSERAGELGHRQGEELGEHIVGKSLLYHLAHGERTLGQRAFGGRYTGPATRCSRCPPSAPELDVDPMASTSPPQLLRLHPMGVRHFRHRTGHPQTERLR